MAPHPRMIPTSNILWGWSTHHHQPGNILWFDSEVRVGRQVTRIHHRSYHHSRRTLDIDKGAFCPIPNTTQQEVAAAAAKRGTQWLCEQCGRAGRTHARSKEGRVWHDAGGGDGHHDNWGGCEHSAFASALAVPLDCESCITVTVSEVEMICPSSHCRMQRTCSPLRLCLCYLLFLIIRKIKIFYNEI